MKTLLPVALCENRHRIIPVTVFHCFLMRPCLLRSFYRFVLLCADGMEPLPAVFAELPL